MRTSTFIALALGLVTSLPAQEISVARAAAQIDTTIPWMTDGFSPPDPGHPVPRLPKTEVDRNKLLDEALKKAGDEKKLVLWYIPRIEGIQMYRPQPLDDYMRSAAFTNPLLANLIAGRFVPVRMAASKDLFDRTGIKNVDWMEPAIAILDASGKIVHRLDRIRTFNADFFRQTLLTVLEKNAATAPVPEGVVAACNAANFADPKAAFQASRNAVWAGYDSGAEKIADVLIKDGKTDFIKCHGNFLKAAMRRIRRDGPGALAALDAAQQLAGEDAELKGLITTERGVVLFKSGDVAGARSFLADAAGMAENPRRAEAAYLAAVARTLSPADRAPGGRAASAEDMFRKVVEDFPDTPYAAQAALNVMVARDTTQAGPAMHAFEDPFWPPEAVFAELPNNTAWSRPADQANDAVKRTVTFLLEHQSDSGGWLDSRYAYWPNYRILPNTWMAITAIALSGLSDWRDVDPERIDKAIARGEKFLFTASNLAPGQNEECYADAFRLLYLKRRLARLDGNSPEAAKARERLNTVAKALSGQQSETGFFAHEYPNPFTTAAVMFALKEAQDGGAAVPASVFDLGAKGLKSVRGANGAFSYGEGRAPGASEESSKNAMARMPICERTILYSGNQQDLTAVEAALDNFWKNLPRFERVRACDFHTDGELAGFFFWHGIYFTSEAIKALPPEKRAPQLKKLLDHVMSIGEIDGSFIDSHEMGKSYGSGMALMVLRNVIEQKP
jgi:hypothetical protein